MRTPTQLESLHFSNLMILPPRGMLTLFIRSLVTSSWKREHRNDQISVRLTLTLEYQQDY